MSTGAVPAFAMRRPGFIVVFRERTDGNISVLSSVRRVGQATGIRARTGQVILEAKDPAGPVTKVYERLRVAATDLDDSERQALESNEKVAAVVPNQVRMIPPIRPSSLSGGIVDALATQQGVPPAISPRTWGLEAIGITGGYQRASGKGVRVAVLDTGINLHHPDFAGHIQDGHTASFIAGESVQDGHGHGTHCCGVVAGPRISVGGIRYGVAPDVELFVGKVLNDQGRGDDDIIIDGIDWAAEHGCKVISMSLGSPRNPGEPFSAVYEAVAQQLLEGGVLIVAAAGNDSNRPSSVATVGNPAACPSILAVAAVDRHMHIAEFSCKQLDSVGEVNLSGPGVQVYSSFKGDGFATLDGTSMAAPHVSGTAALYLEANPGVSGRLLWNKLQETARPLEDASDFGRGLVQAP